MSMYGKNHYNIVIILQLIKIKGKKELSTIVKFIESESMLVDARGQEVGF